MKPYRPSVAIILQDRKKRILIGRRIDYKEAWQFPQGGVDAGESLEGALHREVEEEIGLKPADYQILEVKGGYRYDFPPGRRRFAQFKGQEQTYYLCQIGEGKKKKINTATKSPEFTEVRWIYPEDFQLNWLPEFKIKAYQQVLGDFFGLKFSAKKAQ